MKIDRNRARKGAVVARRFSVSPVTRAVRSVLTVSAAALAFSGTGLALASVPVHTTQAPAFAAQHADLSQHAAFAPSVPVVDLTVVGDSEYPASVVAGDIGLQSALSDGDLQYAGPVGPGSGDAFDRVFDVANVQSFAAPGPGGGSGGSDDQVFFNFVSGADFPGAWFVSPHYNSISVTSNTGLADGWFISVNSIDELDADWTMDITGATWAAGVEMEAATHGYVRQTGDITATATYASGQAIGVYVSAGTDARISNDGGSVNANATGAYGIAVGLFGYADSGVADVGNNGLLTATANNAGTAFGVSSTSVDGTAFGANNGTMSVSGGDFGTGVSARSFYGTYARAMNNGTMTVFGGYSAIGLDASADYGNALASNGAYGSIQVDSLDQAIGMQSIAGGNAAANNMGDVTATATALFGYAFGQVAIGGSASGNNDAGATMTVSGNFIGIGMDVEGDTNASATNSGQLDVHGGFAAMGMYAGANGNAFVGNGGTLNVDSVDGNAFGIMAFAGNVATASNGGPLTVSSVYGDAIGVQAISMAGDAYANNTGPLKVSGDNAKGLYAISYGTGDAHAENSGTINAGGVNSAYGMYALSVSGDASIHNSGTGTVGASADGLSIGAFASGANASIKNDGDIVSTSNSFISEGVFALGANADVTNNGTISAYGLAAFGVDSEGVNGATVTNNGTVVANGYFRATGVYATSTDGGVTVNNGGNVDVDAFGVAYGVYAAGAGAVTVTSGGTGINARSEYTDAIGVFASGDVVGVSNTGAILADGNSFGAGIFAGGNTVTVDNNSGSVNANARAGDGFAVGILAVGGDITVGNGSFVGATGAYATGIDVRAAYSASVTNHAGGTVQVDGSFATGISVRSTGEGENASATNDGTIHASGTASVSGIEAVSRAFQGTGTVINNGTVTITSSYAGAPYPGVAQGLVAAGDTGALITNTIDGRVNVTGATAAYGALALSADVEASFTNDGSVDVHAVGRGGAAFGAVVQGNTGIAAVTNTDTGFIYAQGDVAYGAYATGLFSHASVDNSGQIFAFGNAGNAFGALAYSYNNLATTNNDGVIIVGAAGGAVGMESLSLFGDAGVSNDGFLYAGGGTRARGEIARSLYGEATTSNGDTILVRSNGNAYGMWSRGDFGTADANNDGVVDVQSFGRSAYGVLSGGYYGSTITNTVNGKVDAVGYASAIALAGYSNGGDTTITNGGSAHASAYGLSYGIQALAAYDATVTNTGSISSISRYAVGDGIYANATNVSITNTGDIVAKGGYWSAGIEGRGDVVSILSSAGTVDAYVYDGNAFGLFALANDDATVRNNSVMSATAQHGNAYGEFAIAGDHAITTNGNDITVRAFDGVAYGVLAAGADVDSTNSGSLDVQGSLAAIGMAGQGQTHSILINHGDINAQTNSGSGTAIGLYSYAVGYARGVNDGTIYARTGNGTAMGMNVYGDTAVVQNRLDGVVRAYANQGTVIGSYSWGTIANTVTNDGTVRASTGYGDATGIMALGYGNVQVNASATSTVSANGNGSGTFTAGILANGDVSGVDNAGLVSVGGSGARTAGIESFGDTSATIDNTGRVYAGAGKYAPTAVIGMLGSANGAVTIDNASLVAVNGGNNTTGIVAASYDGAVNVTNASTGLIKATDGFTNFATGIDASSTYGDVAIDNAGLINAGGASAFPGPKYSFGSTTDYAIGATAYAEHGNASITNRGTVTVLAAQYGAGLVAESYFGDASVQNTGIVHVTVDGDFAIGLGARSEYGNASVGNGVDVTVVNTSGAGIGAAASGNTASATNIGNITVTGDNGAVGVAAQGDAQAYVRNNGRVTVVQTGVGNPYGPAATGLLAYAAVGNASVINDLSVSVQAYDRAVGIDASAYGDTAVVNTNDITVAANHGSATGVIARDMDYAGGNLTSVTNSGAIHAASQYSWAEGVFAGGENVAVTNASIGAIDAIGENWAAGIEVDGDTVAATNIGTVNAQAIGTGYTYAVGISGYGNDALTIANSGHVDATSTYGVAKGVSAYGYGTVVVNNSGTIAAGAFGYAIGIDAEGQGSGTVSIVNTNSITATSDDDFADGVFASGASIDIRNDATIAATAVDWAAGMEVDGDSVTIANGGDITASSTGNGQASGIYAYGSAALTITNSSHITASAYDGGAFGISAYGEYATTAVANGGLLAATSLYGNATGVNAHGDATTVSNAGTIDAVGHDAAFGITASASGTVSVTGNGLLHATANQYTLGIGANGDVTNVNVGGTLVSTADRAAGIRASGNTSASVTTTGHVTATGGQYAIGVQTSADTASFHNTGIVSATASGDDAIAAGGMVFGATASLTNGGTLSASGTGDGGQAIGAFVMGGDVALTNTATINASSIYGATAGALVGAKYGDGTVTNSGTITATGNSGNTVGLVAMSSGDLSVTNGGTITAIDGNYATALGLYADGMAVVTNTGNIVANSNLEGSVAIAGGDGIEDIRNAGLVSGALVLGDGDDVLTNQNHGTWIVRGHGTDFGGGDDHIVNAAGGTIVMNNSAISLGRHASAGNVFTNAGLIAINGGDNSIDLGTGLGGQPLMQSNIHAIAAAPVTVLNPIAFTNNGTISFLDGVTDDVLTIHGDFAGQGALNVDVSLLNQTSDMLYVDGNVVDGTKQALNVRLLDLPNAVQGINIPVVSVTGDSKSGEFVAGTFTIDHVILNANNFVNVKVGVTEHINTANATADLFSLTVAMDGVNDTGALAGDIATGAQSLMTTQVGTFRQRMGVFSRMGDSDTGAWVRVFHDKGTITPEFTLDNMPQNGRFGFEQTNSGVEAGINAYVADGFFVGATLGKSEGKQSLDNGFGSDKLKGDTAGLYMTYLSPNGFYADVSYRWMHFDAELTSAGGRQDSGGDVGAFNVEAGWNVWTSASGLKLVPQAQYTRSEVSNVDILHGDLADFAIDGGTSSRGRVGLELEQNFKSASGATWTPYGALSVVREFKGEQGFTIADTFTGHTSTEGTSGMLEVGANVKMGNLDIFGGLNWTDGGAFDSILGGQVGLRYTW